MSIFRPAAPASSRTSALETSWVITVIILCVCASIWYQIWTAIPVLGARGMMNDFDAFYLAGKFFQEGRLADAYDVGIMQKTQQELSGRLGFMPWTYPPTFDLVTSVLPYGTRGNSYAVFVFLTAGLYVFALWRLAGPYLPGVLLATLPVIVVNLFVGQNGFLTGGLVGLFSLYLLRGQNRSGVPIGLMAIKPHLVFGVALMLLCQRQWKTIIIAFATALALSLLSWAVFGTEVWQAFLTSVGNAGENLAAGYYPLHRMTSVYAFAYRVGLPPEAAFLAQGVTALAAIGLIGYLALRGWNTRYVLGITLMATLAIYPYNYDYDLTFIGVALAVLAADLIRLASPRERIVILILSWLSCGMGLKLMADRILWMAGDFGPINLTFIGAPANLALLLLTVLILARDRQGSGK